MPRQAASEFTFPMSCMLGTGVQPPVESGDVLYRGGEGQEGVGRYDGLGRWCVAASRGCSESSGPHGNCRVR